MSELETSVTRQVTEDVTVPACDECGTEVSPDDQDVVSYEPDDPDAPVLHYHKDGCLEAAAISTLVNGDDGNNTVLRNKYGSRIVLAVSVDDLKFLTIMPFMGILALLLYRVAGRVFASGTIARLVFEAAAVVSCMIAIAVPVAIVLFMLLNAQNARRR